MNSAKDDPVSPGAVAIIPARGGSVGIPGKNLMDFCGKPLLVWSIEQAHAASSVEAVYVSSDCDEILQVAEHAGAATIRRPDSLSTDESSSESAVLHALDEIAGNTGADPKIVVFLQATSPLRTAADIDGAMDMFLNQNSDSLFSGALLDDICLWRRSGGHYEGVTFDPFSRTRRQERTPFLLENGSIYIFKPHILREKNNRIGGKISFFPMESWKSGEIDTADEAETLQMLFRHHGLDRAGGKQQDFTRLKLLVYDFDGVMTDNRAYVLEDGREAVSVNRGDGLGIEMLRNAGIAQLIISTETNPVVTARARKVGLDVIQGSENKADALRSYCEEKGISLDCVGYVGNDINDLQAMSLAGVTVAPSDAHPTVRGMAHCVMHARGGDGVIRELADYVLERIEES